MFLVSCLSLQAFVCVLCAILSEGTLETLSRLDMLFLIFYVSLVYTWPHVYSCVHTCTHVCTHVHTAWKQAQCLKLNTILCFHCSIPPFQTTRGSWKWDRKESFTALQLVLWWTMELLGPSSSVAVSLLLYACRCPTLNIYMLHAVLCVARKCESYWHITMLWD